MVRNRAARTARPAVTGRALVLGTVVIVLVVLLASPLHRYFGSRGDVSSAAQQLQSDQTALSQLKQQQAQWSDPGFIEQQARSRLQYAMPGDTVYVVVGAGQTSNLNGPTEVKTTSTEPTGSTWNTRLWGSIQAAGAAPN